MLNIDFGQGAAKISEVKVGGQKNLPISPARTRAPGVGRVGRYFFRTTSLTSDIFAAPWPKSMFSTSFERSTSYLFGFWVTFKVCNLGSKYSYFNRAYVVSVKTQLHTTVTFHLRDTTVQCKWSTFFSLVYTQGERKHANPIQWNLHLCFFLYLSKGFLPLWPLCRGNPFILTRRCLNGT